MSSRKYPWYGWIGIVGLILGELFLARGVGTVARWFTPIMWTAYFLAIDALVHRLGGSAWLIARRREFPLMVLVSVAVWTLFEAYNLHLKNWVYLGVPTQAGLRLLAYFWAFATIMPGVFVTSALVETLWRRTARPVARPSQLGPSWLWFLLGLAMVTVPLALPEGVAALLFAPVWIGFIFLLDPVNEALNADSLRRQWQAGDRATTISLLIGGLTCGFLWEAWNYQALLAHGGHWIYTIPQALRLFGWHYGQMPVLGLGGFPPFALELFAFYSLSKSMLGGDRVFGSNPAADGRVPSRTTTTLPAVQDAAE
jgi:hypothetical protein